MYLPYFLRRSLVFALLCLVFTAGFAAGQTIRVHTMPGYPNIPRIKPGERHQARPDTRVVVWGNALGGVGKNYTWSFEHNPNEVNLVYHGSPAGTVKDERFVFVEVTFQLQASYQWAYVTARLEVEDGQGGKFSKHVEIYVVARSTPFLGNALDDLAVDANIAIQDGLRWLYLNRRMEGSNTAYWQGRYSNVSESFGTTGFSLWAFQNQGHFPSNDPDEDIYAELVQQGLNYVFWHAVKHTDLSAPRADTVRGATQPQVSDLNQNGMAVEFCPYNRTGYATPIVCAAVVASNSPERVVDGVPASHFLFGKTYREVVEDCVDWMGANQSQGDNNGLWTWKGRGGWRYQPNSALNQSDMSINSWFYIAMDAAEEFFQIKVPDWIKQETEYSLFNHQTVKGNVIRGFGYTNRSANYSPGSLATTGGGTSGLVLVERIGNTSTLKPGLIFQQGGDDIADMRRGAVAALGSWWAASGGGNGVGQGNRGNPYTMWTVARALRITARALGLPQDQVKTLYNSSIEFDWQTGEIYLGGKPSGQIEPSGSAREGYFPYLIRTQERSESLAPASRGSWNHSGYYGRELTTACYLLVLTPKVFSEPCPREVVIPIKEMFPPTGQRFLVGTTITLTGRALAEAAHRPIVAVFVNEEPVDSLDASGRFFKRIQIQPGENKFVIRAVERCGSDTTEHVLHGFKEQVPPPIENMSDVSHLIGIRYRNTTYQRAHGSLLTDAYVINQGPTVLDAPITMVIRRFTHPSLMAVNPDGFTKDNHPYFTFLSQGSKPLGPQETSPMKRLIFYNPNQVKIDFDVQWLALGNQPPYFESVPPTRAYPGVTYRYQAVARDPENQKIIYRLRSYPVGMSVHPDTGLVTWEPIATQVGMQAVILEAADERGGYGWQRFFIDTRERGGLNQPPYFSSSPPTETAVGKAYAYQATAWDPENDRLTFEKISGPANLDVSATGLVAWSVPERGDHVVSLKVVDEKNASALQTYVLSVGKRSSNPHAPVLYGSPPVYAIAGRLYVYQPVAYDPDENQKLTFGLVAAPTGMQIDPDTGRISWTPGTSQVSPPAHPVVLEVNDGAGGVAIQSWDVNVDNPSANRAPIITSSPVTRAEVEKVYAYDVTGQDPDLDPIEFSLELAPPGMKIENLGKYPQPQWARITWTPTAVGPVKVIVKVQDNRGGFSFQGFDIQVEPLNHPPRITSTPPLTAVVGVPYRYVATAEDPDQHELAFVLKSGPVGMVVHPTAGVVSWIPTKAQLGKNPVQIAAEDGHGGTAPQAFEVVVSDDLEPPLVDLLVPSLTVFVNEPVRIRVGATDNVAVARRTLTAGGQPVTLDANGWAVVTFTEVGEVPLVGQAFDPSDNMGEDKETLKVVDPFAGAPKIALENPAPETVITEPVKITGTIEKDTTGQGIHWTVHLTRMGSNVRQLLGEGTTEVKSGELGALDPTLLPNDGYVLTITATEEQKTRVAEYTLHVAGDRKLGRCTYRTTDVALAAAGVPLTVGRRYDSFDTSPGDFGPGWRLALAGNLRDTAGDGPGQLEQPFTTRTRVYVDRPDGRRIGFTFTPVPAGDPLGILRIPAFTPDPGVTERLELTREAVIVVSGGQFFEFVIPFNPREYCLVTGDGTRHVIDEHEGLRTIQYADGGTVTLLPDGMVNSAGVALAFVRDGEGRIARITEPVKTAVSQQASVSSATLAPVLPAGEIAYDYDPTTGCLIGVRDQEGQETTLAYEDARFPLLLTRVEDPMGRAVVRHGFDASGRLVMQCGPDGDPKTGTGCTKFTWDPGATVQTVMNPRGYRIDLHLDAWGRVVKERRWLAGQTAYLDRGRTFDPATGMLLTETDPDGKTTRYTYDDWRHLATQTDPGGAIWSFAHDDAGRLVQQQDPLGNAWHYGYVNGRLRHIKDPLAGSMEILPDACGKPASIVDAVGNKWLLAYDAYGQLNSMTGPRGFTTQNHFNVLGELEWRVDANGLRVDFQYDKRHRVVEAVWQTTPPRVVQYGYNVAGQLTRAAGPDSTLDLTYWPTGRLRSVAHTYTGAGPRTEVTYGYLDGTTWKQGYDAHGHVTHVFDSLGGLTQYTYDALDRLVGIQQGHDRQVDVDYQANGLVASVKRYSGPNLSVPDVTTRFEYGHGACPLDLTRILHLQGAGSTVLLDLGYVRHLNHGVQTLIEGATPAACTHDSLGRLLQIVEQGQSTPREFYTYDAVGNRVTSHASANHVHGYQRNAGGNELLEDDAGAYDYDKNGNLIRRTDRTTGDYTVFTYDPENQWKSATGYDAAHKVRFSVVNTYDPLGRCVATSVNGTVRHRVHDHFNPILVLDAAGKPLSRRLYGRRIDAVLGDEAAGATRWFLTDPVGSVRALVAPDGTRLTEIRYDAFGRVLHETQPAVGNDLLFTSRPYCREAGLYHARQRAYAPDLGRFLQSDLRDRDYYTYARNDPLQLGDPLGTSEVVATIDLHRRWVGAPAVGDWPRTGFRQALPCLPGRLWRNAFFVGEAGVGFRGLQVPDNPGYRMACGYRLRIPAPWLHALGISWTAGWNGQD